MAIELPQDCEPRFCVEVACAYDMLASALDVDPTSEIQGPMKRMAMAARKTLRQCVLALRVIAGWIRALGELQASSQCEFCYRHRAGKKRCAVHLVKDHVTKEARLAVATHPLYVERFVELARRVVVQWALVRPLQVDAAARSRVEAEIRVHDLPNELVPQVGTLVVQLRRLQPIFGEVLAGEVALLFQKLLVLARETHHRPFGRSVAEREANRQALDILTGLKAR